MYKEQRDVTGTLSVADAQEDDRTDAEGRTGLFVRATRLRYDPVIVRESGLYFVNADTPAHLRMDSELQQLIQSIL